MLPLRPTTALAHFAVVTAAQSPGLDLDAAIARRVIRQEQVVGASVLVAPA